MSRAVVPHELLAFLRDLEQNNDKDWFAANRDRYEQSWMSPALALCEALIEPLHAISPHLKVAPKKVGGSIPRIHRDMRFSKDKAPYKTSLTLRFGHTGGQAALGYFLRVDTRQLVVGAGIWQPDSASLAKIRSHIAAHPDHWREVRDALVEAVGPMGGESLKRPPKGYDADHPLIDDLRRKSFVAFGEHPVEEAVDTDLLPLLNPTYRASAPFIGFLCEALDLPW